MSRSHPIVATGVLVWLVAGSANAQVLSTRAIHRRLPTGAARLSVFSAPGPNDFGVVVQPAKAIVRRGDMLRLTVQIAAGAMFSGTVQLSVTNLPANLQPAGSIVPDHLDLTAGSNGVATVTISTTGATPTGTPPPVRVTVSGGGMEHTVQCELVILGDADVLSQGTVAFDTDELAKPSVAVQVLDRYFGPAVFHFRATLPTSSTTPPQGQSIFDHPNKNLRDQLLDFFGGVFNIGLGAEWLQIGPRGAASLDARGALKLVEVPKSVEETTAKQAYTNALAFSAGVKGSVVLYDSPRPDPDTLYLVASYHLNALPQETLAGRFSTPLAQLQHNFNAGFVASIPELHFYATAIYRSSNDPQTGHQIIFSVSPSK